MEPKQKSELVWDKLLRLAIARCDHNETLVSLLMGRSRGFLAACRRRRKGGASLEDTLRLAATTRLPDCVVFGRLFPSPEEPAAFLRLLASHLDAELDEAEPSPILARVDQVWQSLTGKEVRAAERPPLSPRRRLVWLDELRLEERAEAFCQIENEIRLLLISLSNSKTIEPGALGDLAFALALWSDIQRAEGHHRLAIAASPLALELAERSEDRWVLGHCLWMAALLLHEIGLPDCGLPWLDRAAALFSLDNHPSHGPEILVCQGILALAAGLAPRGLAALRDALARLPASNRRWRHVALLQLGAYSLEAGKPQEALTCFGVLISETSKSDLGLGQLLWRRAIALLLVGEVDQCLAAFAEAMALIAEHGTKTDVAYALCDFAEYFLQRGQATNACLLTGEVLLLLRDCAAVDPKLLVLLENLYAKARLRTFGQADIDDAREALKDFGPAPPIALPRHCLQERPAIASPPAKATAPGQNEMTPASGRD